RIHTISTPFVACYVQMARLNEVAAPTESIESLKRKFMRQNRDIARANSTQSLRIRNLENETSRLLADNLGLREQIIRLQNELDNGQAQRIRDHTNDVKSQLEAKLQEIGTLITDLGHEPTRKRKSAQGGQIIRASPSTSPDQRNWKNMCTLSEAMAGQEGRLPPIMENKSYPRRTLERQDVVNLIADAEGGLDTTESPEIGPPPVSQFVDEDPVKIDLPKRIRKNDLEDLAGLDPSLSINLEQRRKRKEILGPSEPKGGSNATSAPGGQENAGSLKTGAKRKLSVRDDDEPEPLPRTVQESPDDFRFTRVVSEDKARSKTVSQPENTGHKATRELAVARGAPREKRSSTSTTTNRKALAPKSVNNSPRKIGRVPIQDDIKAAKNDVPKFNPTKDNTREKKSEPITVKPQSEPLVDTVEIQPEPETPAAVDDVFSPSSSQPSTARVESRDTPPPPDLGSDVQRPSRRSRGAVSYAEPSLRDKMRRPTKDLVDAVSGEGKSNRGSIVKVEEGRTSTGISIKAEAEEEDAWKRMPLASSETVENSPLRSKAPDQDALPSSITTHRKRRESILYQTSENTPKTGSETAISSLLSEHRKAKAAAKERALEKEGILTKAMDKLDIYEFNETSPPGEAVTSRPSQEDKLTSRSTRRASAIPKDLASVDDGEASDIEATKKKEAPMSRRRQSTLGLKGSSANTGLGPDKTVRKTSSTSGFSDSTGAGDTRGDRIAARRRSMML
ncbi:Shugoshin, partial [Lachnellula suecica]